jgi:hypothetical protein
MKPTMESVLANICHTCCHVKNDYSNIIDGSVRTKMNNTEDVGVASKETGLEVNSDNTK